MLHTEIITQRDTWHALLCQLPHAHILQSWEWGDFKQQTTGWTPQRIAYREASGGGVVAAASVLTRRLGVFSLMYVPKGPALDYQNTALCAAVLAHLQAMAGGAVWLKIDPDLPVKYGAPPHETPDPVGQALQATLQARAWRYSADQVQFPNTILLDLTQSEDALWAGMNQGTRRKIRQAEKAGVVVRPADLTNPADLHTLYQLYTITGGRQGFITRPLDYYRAAWSLFAEAGLAQGMIAELDGEALAGLVLFHLGQKVWYFYGMSSNQQREAQPNYALQWAAIRWAKAAGYPVYDWWGAPTFFDESDPLWGVYRFKDGFGGRVVQHIGAWDFAPHPLLYWGYARLRRWLR